MAQLDPSIIMRAGQYPRRDPLETHANVLAIKGQERKNQLEEAKWQDAQRQRAAQEQQRAAIQGAYNSETGDFDKRRLKNAFVGSGDWESALGVDEREQKRLKGELDAEGKRLEVTAKRMENLGRILQSVTDQPSYDRARQWMQRNGMDVSDVPMRYDPQDVRDNIQASMTALQQMKLGMEERRTRASERNAAKAPVSITVDNSGQRVPYKLPPGFMLKDENDYRKGVTPVPGGPQDEMPPADAAKTQMIESSIGSVREFQQMLMPGGKVDRKLLATMTAGIPFSQGREATVLIKDAIEAKLRAESGAAVPEQEVTRAAERFMPSMMDNDATIQRKLGLLDAFMRGTFDKIDPSGRFDIGGTMNSIPSTSAVPNKAVEHLRKNPNLAPMFDQKYGEGAAASYLGG